MADPNGSRVGMAVFGVGAFLMALGSLLPWFLFPLYIRYGWTKDFLKHVWPQTLIGNTPLVVLAWILSLPLGVLLIFLGQRAVYRARKDLAGAMEEHSG